ncbi:hypothetical protein BLNAU_1901 [Blattamonas nauphoetae]|uniref:EF-hand domain-containing protein n=1 Tax=Blattamonas nauphoetae TaxID=2049346 RepID=A0ABQ9YHX3_9EUKA|nr:hypothetical protein BLNAU_1901 [Blattamonas nauphoetae]
MDDIDPREEGLMNFAEFVRLHGQFLMGADFGMLTKDIFSMVDRKRRGFLTVHDLAGFMSDLNCPVTANELQTLLTAIDPSFDSKITPTLFSNLVRSCNLDFKKDAPTDTDSESKDSDLLLRAQQQFEFKQQSLTNPLEEKERELTYFERVPPIEGMRSSLELVWRDSRERSRSATHSRPNSALSMNVTTRSGPKRPLVFGTPYFSEKQNRHIRSPFAPESKQNGRRTNTKSSGPLLSIELPNDFDPPPLFTGQPLSSVSPVKTGFPLLSPQAKRDMSTSKFPISSPRQSLQNDNPNQHIQTDSRTLLRKDSFPHTSGNSSRRSIRQPTSQLTARIGQTKRTSHSTATRASKDHPSQSSSPPLPSSPPSTVPVFEDGQPSTPPRLHLSSPELLRTPPIISSQEGSFIQKPSNTSSFAASPRYEFKRDWNGGEVRIDRVENDWVVPPQQGRRKITPFRKMDLAASHGDLISLRASLNYDELKTKRKPTHLSNTRKKKG